MVLTAPNLLARMAEIMLVSSEWVTAIKRSVFFTRVSLSNGTEVAEPS